MGGEVVFQTEPKLKFKNLYIILYCREQYYTGMMDRRDQDTRTRLYAVSLLLKRRFYFVHKHIE